MVLTYRCYHHINGLSILQQFRELDPTASTIILTGDHNAQLEHEARTLGAAEVLPNGFPLRAIGDMVSSLHTQNDVTNPLLSLIESHKDVSPHTERRNHPRTSV
jgi:DNA-binding NarL/FixJ family response regulator